MIKIDELTYQLGRAQVSGTKKDTLDEHFRVGDS